MKKTHIPIVSTIFDYYRVYEPFIGKRLFLLLCVTVVATYIEGLGISLFLPLLSGSESIVNGEDNVSRLLRWFFETFGIPNTITASLLVMLGAFLLKGSLKLFEGIYQSHLTGKIIYAEMRKKLMRDFAGMSYRYYIRTNTGMLTNTVTTEVTRATQSFNFYSQSIVQLITILSFLVILLFMNWELTLMAGAYGLLVLFAFRFLSRRSKKYSRLHTREHAKFQGLLIQAIQTFKYLVSTARFALIERHSITAIKKLALYRYKVNAATATLKAMSDVLVIVFFVLVMLYYVEVIQVPIAPILVAIPVLFRLMLAVMLFQGTWQQFSGLIGSVDNVRKTTSELGQDREIPGPVELGGIEKSLKFENVSFSYGEGNVLENLTLEISRNKTIALVGESGSGKSTMIDLITGVLRPTNGRIFIDGIDTETINYDSLRAHIGYVTQDCAVFDDTVANNISMWSCEPDDPTCVEKVRKASRQAYCEDFVEAMPEQFETEIGDKGVRLSGGQRQRLAIARELFREPGLLLLDEATSALDSESERYIQQSIDSLKGKITVVMIAHRLSTVRNADCIYVLDQGRIVEQGSFDELYAREGSRFRQMCELQNISA